MSDLVSVVLATYAGDNEKHLDESLGSIFSQSYVNIELIVVVDGPVSDDRLHKLAELSRRPNAEVIFVPFNKGPAFARNTGIERARGKYIAVMDADDIAKPERISHQLGHLVEHGLDAMSSDLEIIDDAGIVTGLRTVPVHYDDVVSLAPYRCPLHNPSLFCKADVLKKNLYDISFRVSEDYELWVRLLMKGYKLGNTSYRCVQYRQSGVAIGKRKGIKYAHADLRVKFAATKMVAWKARPWFLLSAAATASFRLMPTWIFNFVYRRRELIFRKFKQI